MENPGKDRIYVWEQNQGEDLDWSYKLNLEIWIFMDFHDPRGMTAIESFKLAKQHNLYLKVFIRLL